MKSKELPKLKKSEFNADEYDCIIIGSPTWGSCYAPAIKAFAKKNKIENKKICLFTTYAGGGDKQCIDAMKKLFPNNKFIAYASFKNPKKADKEILRTQLEDFSKKVLGE
jgi:flavodoxin